VAMGDVWIGATQAATKVIGAVIRANPGPVQNPTVDRLDDAVVSDLTSAADFLEGYPETAEFAARVREIAFRYSRGRPNARQWRGDKDFATTLGAAMMRRLTGK
jgi:hypothetical protein